jgi:hypothetical protein
MDRLESKLVELYSWSLSLLYLYYSETLGVMTVVVVIVETLIGGDRDLKTWIKRSVRTVIS